MAPIARFKKCSYFGARAGLQVKHMLGRLASLAIVLLKWKIAALKRPRKNRLEERASGARREGDGESGRKSAARRIKKEERIIFLLHRETIAP